MVAIQLCLPFFLKAVDISIQFRYTWRTRISSWLILSDTDTHEFTIWYWWIWVSVKKLFLYMIETLIQVRQIGHRSVCHSTRHCVQLLQFGQPSQAAGFRLRNDYSSRWITNSMNRSVRPVVACCCWIISVFIATYQNISSSIFNCLTKPNSHSMYYTYKILWASNHNVDNPASEVVSHQENTQLLLLLWHVMTIYHYV